MKATTYPIHPLCALFPEATEAEVADMKADILANGQLEPIVLLDGQILDGRTRYRCCLELGIEPKFIQFSELNCACSPKAYVIGKNYMRRHLSLEQRGMIAAKLTTSEFGNLTKKEAAIAMNVSKGTVTRAKNVAKNGIPEVQAEMESGLLSISQADRVAKKPVAQQPEALAAEKKAASESKKKVAETKAAGAAARNLATAAEKAIATYSELSALCDAGQFNGKKNRRVLAQLTAAVDDFEQVEEVLAEMTETGHAYHNLTVSVDMLEKHPGISVEVLKKTLSIKQQQHDVARHKFNAMLQFAADFPALTESLHGTFAVADDQKAVDELTERFVLAKTAFDEAIVRYTTQHVIKVLTVADTHPPMGWFEPQQEQEES